MIVIIILLGREDRIEERLVKFIRSYSALYLQKY
jgi:hypothetical protein